MGPQMVRSKWATGMSEAKEENRPPHGHGERSEVRDAAEKAAKGV